MHALASEPMMAMAFSGGHDVVAHRARAFSRALEPLVHVALVAAAVLVPDLQALDIAVPAEIPRRQWKQPRKARRAGKTLHRVYKTLFDST